MKKIILIFTLLLTYQAAKAQLTCGIQLDPAISIVGDKDFGKGINFVVTAGYNDRQVEAVVFYEQLNLIGFESYGIQISKVLDLLYSQVLYGSEFGVIERHDKDYYPFYGINLEYRRMIFTKNLYLGYRMNFKNRPELDRFVYSGYITLTYNLY